MGKEQVRKSKSNKPKLTAKERKEKKQEKRAAKGK